MFLTSGRLVWKKRRRQRLQEVTLLHKIAKRRGLFLKHKLAQAFLKHKFAYKQTYASIHKLCLGAA